MMQEQTQSFDFIGWNLAFLGASVLGLFFYFVFVVRKRRKAGYRHEESTSDQESKSVSPKP